MSGHSAAIIMAASWGDRETERVTDPGTGTPWHWDPSLYQGTASFYALGRVAYPAALVDRLVAHLGLDGRGRLLDLGCGPASLTLPLSAHFLQVVAVDADADMLAEGKRRALAAAITNIEWIRARAEELTLDPGCFRLVSMAQSFHWMDRELIAQLLRLLLQDDGAVAYVYATTHQGVASTAPLPHPQPPWDRIDALMARFLGEGRRAGQGFFPSDGLNEVEREEFEAGIFRAAGFTGPERLSVPGWVVERTADDVVASVFSRSYAAPHLFGDRIGEFERELRSVLTQVSPRRRFSEEMRDIAVDIWRVPADDASD